jgi:signal transduction histidine kinase
MKILSNNPTAFIRKNPTVVYSVFLIIIITGIIFFNAYYSLNKFQQSKDALLQKKAVLAEDIFQYVAVTYLQDPQALQEVIGKVKQSDTEITGMSVAVPVEGEDTFRIIADSSPENVSKTDGRVFNALAWQSKDTGIAFLDSASGSRFWTVIKPVLDETGQKKGLVALKLSLADSDAFTEDAIRRVYVVAIVSMLLVLLLVGNHARLFSYAIKAAHLEEVDRMKDDFISMASHELKSPLTAMKGYVDLLRDSENTEAERNRYLQNMATSITRLNTLVEDLLEVSRIEQNRIPVVIQQVDAAPLVASLVDEMKVSARQKNLDLSCVFDTLPKVNADPDRLKQIIVNLISNAIKYTPKGSVTVSAKADGRWVYVTVADTGIGMSSQQAKDLFGKFYRVVSEQTKQISGTGLGLWISRELARKMKGDITVESIEGVGSHFTLQLPKS